MKLKTLKDLLKVKHVGAISARQMKAEAIKWVKFQPCPSCNDCALRDFTNITSEDLK